MESANPMRTVHEAIEAHGGLGYWNSLEALEVELSAKGFLFTAKRRPVLRHVRMRASVAEPELRIFDFPAAGQTAEFRANDGVCIRDATGSIIVERENPRATFRGIRRQLFWYDLDFIYFAGYATWNYLTTPFMLVRPGFHVELLKPAPGALANLIRLGVTFPADIPTHSRQQVFYFDDQRLLRRLDYTAEVVGSWAHAAHLIDEYGTFDRLRAPTRRRVLPLLFGSNPLAKPVLVELILHHIRPVPAGG